MWPEAQHDTVKDRLPRNRRDFDHSWVAQELREITPDGPRFWCIRGAEIDQQHTDLRRRRGGMIGGARHQAAIGSNGSERIRFPLPAKMALATAGARTVVPRPLTPPGASPLGMISTAISGASPMRGRPMLDKRRARGIPASHSGLAAVAWPSAQIRAPSICC